MRDNRIFYTLYKAQNFLTDMGPYYFLLTHSSALASRFGVKNSSWTYPSCRRINHGVLTSSEVSRNFAQGAILVDQDLVKINQACSGIRSLQNLLSLGVFLSIYFRFDWGRFVLSPFHFLPINLVFQFCSGPYPILFVFGIWCGDTKRMARFYR